MASHSTNGTPPHGLCSAKSVSFAAEQFARVCKRWSRDSCVADKGQSREAFALLERSTKPRGLLSFDLKKRERGREGKVLNVTNMFHRARVLQIANETPTVKRILFGVGETFSYLSGQVKIISKQKMSQRTRPFLEVWCTDEWYDALLCISGWM